jgi:putative transposase
VTDEHGRVLEDGLISGMGLRFVQRTLERRIKKEQRRRGHVSITARRAQADEAVHTTANVLVAIAKRHGARIVVEELTMQRRLKALPVGDKGGRGGRNFRRILGRQQYGKLVQVLTYKLARVGLPPPIAVGAAFTSQTCPECGCVDKANRPRLKVEGSDVMDTSRFACVKCGHSTDADKNAARIISIKGAWFTQLPTKKERGGRDLRDDEKFDHYLFDASRRRGLSGK